MLPFRSSQRAKIFDSVLSGYSYIRTPPHEMRNLTLGSPVAFSTNSVLRGNRVQQSNTFSVSHPKHTADTPQEEGLKTQNMIYYSTYQS